MKNENKVALVTGASSGIGKAVYNLLVKNGWKVYGTSRKIEIGKIENVDGGKMIHLDVCKEQSVKDAIEIINKAEGKLDALVNNAGNGIAGAVEDTTYEEMLFQFETNFFGTMRVINASLDMLRPTKGIIVNVSSVAGVLSIPFQGMYSASKAALESASEALRMELKDDGVRVCLVEPGDTKTEFTANRMVVYKAKDSRYAKKMSESVKKMEKDEQNGTPPEYTAKVIYKLINKTNPPIRCAVGFTYKALLFLKRFLPDKVVMLLVGDMYA